MWPFLCALDLLIYCILICTNQKFHPNIKVLILNLHDNHTSADKLNAIFHLKNQIHFLIDNFLKE